MAVEKKEQIKRKHFKMLVVVSHIFVADTKIIFGYNSVVPLTLPFCESILHNLLLFSTSESDSSFRIDADFRGSHRSEVNTLCLR